MRREQPVYHNERLGIWALSRYRDVDAALKNIEVFSSAKGIGPERVSIPIDDHAGPAAASGGCDHW